MAAETLIGRVLLEQFRVDAFIAAGGMGAVYKVWDLKRQVPLAMKVLHADLAEDPSIFKRFRREANALKKLAHPNIVPFYGLYKTADFAFLLEGYVDGPTLKEVLKRKGRLSAEEALTVLKGVSAALSYAHAHGVVHCDVKPGNVMIDRGGRVYLTDFGIARHAESTTTTFGFAGTAAYMAPEQIRGEPVTPATDVYALGVMAYELLTGRRPFTGEEEGTAGTQTRAERLRMAHLKLTPPDPRQFNPEMPEKAAQVLLKALSKEPEERYQDVWAFFGALCEAFGKDASQVKRRLDLAFVEEFLEEEEITALEGGELPGGEGEMLIASGAAHKPLYATKKVKTRSRWVLVTLLVLLIVGVGGCFLAYKVFVSRGLPAAPANPSALSLQITPTSKRATSSASASPSTPSPPAPSKTKAQPSPTPKPKFPPLTSAQLGNAKYKIGDLTVTLKDGKYQKGDPNSLSGGISVWINSYTLGDLNGDGAPDAAVWLKTFGGGNTVTDSIAVMLNKNGAPAQVADLDVDGNLESIGIVGNALLVDYLALGEMDPFCCPSVRVRERYVLEGDHAKRVAQVKGKSRDDAQRPLTPGPRSHHGWVYNPATHTFVLFGGWDGKRARNDTWEYDGENWYHIETAHAPSPRAGFGMVYDATRQKIVLFGGTAGADKVFGDTWEYDGIDWRQIKTTHSPEPRADMAVAYFPPTGKILLFGGTDQPGTSYHVFGDFWEFDGKDWKQISLSRLPSPRCCGTPSLMVYDARHKQIVLQGGWVGGGCNDETWVYDGKEWQLVAHGPSHYGHAMAYDPETGIILLHGGSNCYSGVNDTWEYNPTTKSWAQKAKETPPEAQCCAPIAYDPKGHRFLMYGGADGNGHILSGLWAYDVKTHRWARVKANSSSASSSPPPVAPTPTPSEVYALPVEAVSASHTALPSRDSRGHPVNYRPSNIIDGRWETAWRTPGNGRGEWVKLTFSQQVEVDRVGIVPGYAKTDPYDGTDRFRQNRVLRRVRLEFSDGTSVEATFDYARKMQFVEIEGGVMTTFVRIVILDTYPPRLHPTRNYTAISEVKIMGRLP